MDYGLIAIMALALGAMWLMSSKNRKRQQEVVDFRANLEPGDEVMTTSGLFGTVVEVDGEIVVLEISPGVTSRWFKPAISKRAEEVIPVFDPVEDDEEFEDGEDAEYEDYDDEVGDEASDDSVRLRLREALEGDVEVPDDASSLTELEQDTDQDLPDDPKQA